jgi:predicted ATPase/DNA-binding SARP family transcriptional activator
MAVVCGDSTMSDSLRLYWLGQFQLERNGQPLALPTRKTEALLAYLVLHPEVHPREWLATLFWGDFVDTEARQSLRTALSALRKTLGEACLLTDRETVQFNPDYPLWADALAFRMQVQRFLGQPLPDPSLVDLTLYQGGFLDGFYEDWILREREALHQLYLRVLLRLTQHWRTQADYVQAIEAAQQALVLDPAEEEAHQHLIFCYTVTGNRTAARQQYEACVRALRTELDVEPSAATMALYRRSQQALSHARLSAAAQSNLPVPLASFIGRTHEIARLKGLLLGNEVTSARQPARLVTVTGPGGCGKTRLAIELACKLLDCYPDGIWWVELATLRDPAHVPQAVAKVLHVEQGVQASLTAALIHALRPQRLLLVLDNCEHLVTASAELAEHLLSQCPALQILATSREALDIAGEVSWLVPSLTLPAQTQHVTPADYLQFEGLRLFVERASAVQRDFALTVANAPAIVEICRQLDGIPLALELAAARVKLLTVEQIAERLTGVIGARFELLTDGHRTVLPRQQTLRATMEWSYALLSYAEQRLLQRLAVFVGGWTLEAAEAVGAEPGDPSVVDGLARLVDKSLVLAEPQGPVVRYRLLETVQEYAYEQLEQTAEAEAVRDRHLAYYLQLAETAEPELYGADQKVWLDHLECEHDNLRATLSRGLLKAPDIALQFASALSEFWFLRGYFHEGRSWLAQALARSAAVPTITRGRALLGAGRLAWIQTDFAQATSLATEGLHLFRWLDNLPHVANALSLLGNIQLFKNKRNQARPLFEQALVLHRQTGDQAAIARTLLNLGLVAMYQNDYPQAKSLLEESVAISQLTNDRIYTALCLANLGYMEVYFGNLSNATPYLREAVLVSLSHGDQETVVLCLEAFAEIAGAALDNQTSLQAAAYLFGTAQTFRNRLAIPLPPMDRPFYEASLSRLRSHMSEAAFSAAWAEGAAMSLEQAVACALRIGSPGI